MDGGVPSSLSDRVTDNNQSQIKSNGIPYDIITIEFKHFDSQIPIIPTPPHH